MARTVPVRISAAPLSIAAAFLRGLFDAEGSISNRGVSIAMANERLIRQVQLLLLRFGITTSVLGKKSRYKPQYMINFRERAALQAFAMLVGVTSSEKAQKLSALLEGNDATASFMDHVPTHGGVMKNFLGKHGSLPKEVRWRYRAFFVGDRLLSKRHLVKMASQLKAITPIVKDEIERYAASEANIARIVSIEPVQTQELFYDLEVPGSENFVANGIIVHNSAQRFGRLREEGIEYFHKRIGEAMDSFLDLKNFKGVIVGGPGPAKEGFLKESPFNYQLKVLGVVDSGYTDEYGLREVLEKSQELLAEHEAVKEKKLLDEFLREIAKGGLATYGFDQIKKALDTGQARELLVSEGLTLYQVDLACSKCGKTASAVSPHKIEPGTEEDNCDCGGRMRVTSDKDLVNELVGIAEQAGIPVQFISRDTAEGQQFYATFSGLGVFLRYK